MFKTKSVFTVLIIFFIFGCNMPQDSVAKPLNQSEAINQANQCYDELKSDLIMERKNEMKNREITLNDVKMKFDLKYYGVKPKEGWSLYFSLHGGGQTEPAVNEKQWVRHQTLYKVNEGIVFIPRSPTNTWNMWHQDHIDPLFNRIIQNMIMLYEVDPDKVYLMGYSAGGDGVYQLAPRMADRFAAAAMMIVVVCFEMALGLCLVLGDVCAVVAAKNLARTIV